MLSNIFLDVSTLPSINTNNCTYFRLNKLPHTIYWKSTILILGMSGYGVKIFLEKMAKVSANSFEPDQTPRSVSSDLIVHCLPINLLGFPDLNGFNCFLEFQLCSQWLKGS